MRRRRRGDENSDDSASEEYERRPIVAEPFDVEDYASRYTSRTKINRLRFIANRFPEQELEALKIAYDEIKKTGDIEAFKEVVAQINGRLGEKYGPDDDWADDVDRKAREREDMLKGIIDDYKDTVIHAHMWEGHNMLGHFYYIHGNPREAYTNHMSKRSYCCTPKHIVDTCFDIILVSIELGIFSSATSHAIMLMALSKGNLDPKTNSQLLCALALANLEYRQYRLAALQLLETKPCIENSYSEVIAPQDIATYGGLCALASFDREELKNLVIDNKDFREFLEWVPEVRELVDHFYASRFGYCWEYLAVLRPTLSLDIHLHDHVEDLYAQIREKALIQYTLPHHSIYIDDMAIDFGTSIADLEQELTALIADRKINGYIDFQKHDLYIMPENPILRQLARQLQGMQDTLAQIRRVLYG